MDPVFPPTLSGRSRIWPWPLQNLIALNINAIAPPRFGAGQGAALVSQKWYETLFEKQHTGNSAIQSNPLNGSPDKVSIRLLVQVLASLILGAHIVKCGS